MSSTRNAHPHIIKGETLLFVRIRCIPPQLLQHPWVAQGHTKAGEHDLSHFKTAMKAYNARRKFKATIMTVTIMGKLGRAMKSSTAEKAAARGTDDGSSR